MSDPMPTTNSVLFSPSMLCQIGQLVGTYAGLHYDKEACRTSPLSGKEYIAEVLTSNERRIHEVLSQIVTKQGRFHMTHSYES